MIDRINAQVDVVMPTYNSNGPWFKRCLLSIKREVPVHCLIILDRYSEDETVEAVKQIFPNAKVVATKENLGKARQLGIRLIDTEWFIFVDSDIDLPKDWFKLITSQVDEDVGGIHGTKESTLNVYEAKFERWSRFRWLKLKERFKIEVFEVNSKNPDDVRGCTDNTLLRTSLVKDWIPPKRLCAYEDHHLLRHLVRKGYNWKIVPSLQVRHFSDKSVRFSLRKVRWDLAGARSIGYTGICLTSLLKSTVVQTIKALMASVNMREPRIFPYKIIRQVAAIQGYLGWSKYLFLTRRPRAHANYQKSCEIVFY